VRGEVLLKLMVFWLPAARVSLLHIFHFDAELAGIDIENHRLRFKDILNVPPGHLDIEEVEGVKRSANIFRQNRFLQALKNIVF
jgi:hypothetical protein